MARQRNSLTSDDLNTIERSLEDSIKAAINQDAVSAEGIIPDIAPLFVAREKIIAMRSKGNGSAETPKVRKARTPRTNATERTEVSS